MALLGNSPLRGPTDPQIHGAGQHCIMRIGADDGEWKIFIG
jgi:hypothetical protein